ncbi:DNA-directed RNA polymerase subunit beta [Candidatus Dependentiae bacterium]|nr:DNA-directed RNA polymerase subunit beta [Candidatus Dependentiae bacterium]
MSRFSRGKGVIRRSFGKIKEVVSLPNLIEIQSKSFNNFIQLDFLPFERKNVGLEKIFRDVFPVEHQDALSLEFVSYELGDWACVCGQLTGIENRYKWSCSSCKKSDCSRLEDSGSCPKCKKNTARYISCKKCSSRVFVKAPLLVDECRFSGKTYSMPLKVKVQLISWDTQSGGKESGERVVKDIKEQEVFFCDLPVMCDLYEGADGSFRLGGHGTFLINGVDRVVVSQIHRAPGVVFTLSKKIKDFRGQPCHMARLIPARGSWLDFEFDHNDILHVRIDKKKKISVTTFLQALGIERDEILPLFYKFDSITVKKGDFYKPVDKSLLGQRLEAEALPESLAKKFLVGQRFTDKMLKDLAKHKVTHLHVRKNSLLNRILGDDVVDLETGEIFAKRGDVLTSEILDTIAKQDAYVLNIIQSSSFVYQPTIALTLAQSSAASRLDALKEVYCKLRAGDVPAVQVMEEFFDNLFFNPRFYDLTRVGRIRTNRKLGLEIDEEVTQLTREDIIETLKYLVALKERGEGDLDDIDHLGNRCVRLVGELLQGQLYAGLARVERIAKERFRLQEYHAALMPYDYLNVKPLAAVLREFFGTGQLSQFMDQTNPLAEMAHKRRLSALGPGGITRERATFEVRDVHTSHYGRICPIETPEGQNIGLISSLATYARVNELGFIETTYRPVNDGVIGDDVVCLDAFQEVDELVAQATINVDAKNKITDKEVLARKSGNIITVDAKDVTYVDASPRQLVSVATSLIPFLEHDDANRALMGSNMQRQAVPLIKCRPPLVGTGMEAELGAAEGAVLVARSGGIVEYVSSEKIVVRIVDGGGDDSKISKEWLSRPVDIYELKKFARSSHNTWIHHVPVVKIGDCVERGDVLTNGAATNRGELALGSNVLVAFMLWHGYNFEDAIVVSKRLVAEDVFTSVHIEEFVVEARDTKLGAEEITRDIPNVSEKDLEALDDDGIVRIGTRVKPGEILVGKVTLKGDVQASPEEKLLRAIFGEKSREVRDTSLRVPPGVEATVVDVKLFSRSGIRKDKRYKEIAAIKTAKIEDDFCQHIAILDRAIIKRVASLLKGKKPKSGAKFKKFLEKDSFSEVKLLDAELDLLLQVELTDKTLAAQLKELKESYKNQISVLQALKEEQISKLRKGDDLPSGVIKMVRVYVAMKRHLSVGDKVAGRHGNKGVISQIVNVEDMPYLEDGTPVDIVLNPLGVPARMNIGQILETILGMVGRKAGNWFAQNLESVRYAKTKEHLEKYYGKSFVEDLEKHSGKEMVLDLAHKAGKDGVFFKTPIFDGADYEEEIRPMLKDLGLPQDAAYKLYNGQTGLPFVQPVTVGYIYMMKLNHLVDDKLHARSVGPYSLITQQPLGGKAQFGGQRLGEMEVWALYAYGAAYALQEMLTVKSDDVNGRVKAYEAIVRGDDIPDPGVPESFNVLVKELQSLGLQVDLFKASKEKVGE